MMPDSGRPARAYLGLGANLGEPLATFHRALGELAARAGAVSKVSRAYRTEALVPAGAPPGPSYWNVACALTTSLAPQALLALALSLEAAAGRRRRARWEPRPLDIDLLLYGDARIDELGLTIPHPRLAERVFVLRPLADVAPDVTVPGLGATVAELLARLPNPRAGILETRTDW